MAAVAFMADAATFWDSLNIKAFILCFFPLFG